MRLLSGLLCAALAWLALAAPAAARDGLARFEREIKPQIDLDEFTYESARPLGSAGFELSNVVAVMPAHEATGDQQTTLEIDKVIVDELDFDRMTPGNAEDMPRFARIRLEGVTGDDELFDALAPYGIPQVPVDLALDYRLDAASKTLTLNTLEIAFRGLARLSLALVIDGISDKTAEIEGARDDGRLRSASFTFEDSGLAAKLLPAMAREQGLAADGLVALALATIAGFAEGQGPETLQALDAIASFVADWQAPKGPLAIGLKPARTAALSDLDKLMPNALTEVFGLSASYAGTRAGAAQSPPTSK